MKIRCIYTFDYRDYNSADEWPEYLAFAPSVGQYVRSKQKTERKIVSIVHCMIGDEPGITIHLEK